MDSTTEATVAPPGEADSFPGADDDFDPDDHVTERVLERLKRIKQLNESGSPRRVLDELRALVVDAEQWARREGDERARLAVDEVDQALAVRSDVRAPALSIH